MRAVRASCGRLLSRAREAASISPVVTTPNGVSDGDSVAPCLWLQQGFSKATISTTCSSFTAAEHRRLSPCPAPADHYKDQASEGSLCNAAATSTLKVHNAVLDWWQSKHTTTWDPFSKGLDASRGLLVSSSVRLFGSHLGQSLAAHGLPHNFSRSARRQWGLKTYATWQRRGLQTDSWQWQESQTDGLYIPSPSASQKMEDAVEGQKASLTKDPRKPVLPLDAKVCVAYVRRKKPDKQRIVKFVDPDAIARVPIFFSRSTKQCGLCLKVYNKREFCKLRSSPDALHYLCRGCWAQRTQEKKGLVRAPLKGKESCVCCGETKDKALFGRDPRLQGGLQKTCRACYSEDYATKPEYGGQKLLVKKGEKPKRLKFLSVVRLGNQVFPEQKRCRECGYVKEAEEFYWEKYSLDGRRTMCIPCFTLRFGGKHFKRRETLTSIERLLLDRLKKAEGDVAKPDDVVKKPENDVEKACCHQEGRTEPSTPGD